MSYDDLWDQLQTDENLARSHVTGYISKVTGLHPTTINRYRASGDLFPSEAIKKLSIAQQWDADQICHLFFGKEIKPREETLDADDLRVIRKAFNKLLGVIND